MRQQTAPIERQNGKNHRFLDRSARLMTTPIRILLVEDSDDDEALLLRELRRGGYEPAIERVDSAVTMHAALDRHEFDLVVADYVLPHFSAVAALVVLRKRGLDLPLIVCSGSTGEGIAIAATKAGARDYVMKGDLGRLSDAIERVLGHGDVQERTGEFDPVAV